MKDTAFHELLASVREAGAIRRGTRRSARTTTFAADAPSDACRRAADLASLDGRERRAT